MFFGVLLASRIGLPSEDGSVVLPLLATQILWINLVTDGAPALALGVDPPDDGLMREMPRPAGEPVITGRMWRCESADEGMAWSKPQPADLSCGGTIYLTHLASGRLALVWNPANWDAPILISPHDPATLYVAGNVVFKSTNRGNAWTVISGDLPSTPLARCGSLCRPLE